ncbi:hypothetical protein L596_019124 [Steinernema carpocapsae]|uniref:RRM domain-containing protein n=1 Tax=Steinernema carpocapsae TaxID=34508 RepID=A0A4V6A291_STECR|nr:hypothetical protein L596_019124 [Steinernema carpocapsae]
MDWHSSNSGASSSQLRHDAPRSHHQDDRHRRPSTSGRQPLPPGPHHRGRVINPQTGREDNYKLIKTHDKPIYRFWGVCADPYSAYNVAALRDPRDRDKINSKTLPQEHPAPDLKLDINYVGIPDQREVAIYNLNDNVNESLLKRFCQKVIDPEELMVCYHPHSRKHMKMALVECRSSIDARKFVKYANDTELMGSKVSASLDPLADQLNSEFNKKTGCDLPTLPRRLKDVGNVLEVLRGRLREATHKNEEPQGTTESSPMDCESECLSPIDVDITPSTSAIVTQSVAPPSASPVPTKVRVRRSRFSDSPDISSRPSPLARVLANIQTSSIHDSSSASPATPVPFSRFTVPPSSIVPPIDRLMHPQTMYSGTPSTSQVFPNAFRLPSHSVPPPSIPPTPTAWEHLPPPPPVPIPEPAGQVTPTPADPVLREAEMKEKRRQSVKRDSKKAREHSTSGGSSSSSSGSSSSSDEEHESSRRRSRKKHSRSYRRRTDRRRRRSRESSSASSESSASSSENEETSSSAKASNDERYRKERRRHSSHRYSSSKRSESRKRKVTEKIVTHKRQVITSKDASTVKDTYIHIVSRRFEKEDSQPSDAKQQRISPDSDDLPIINEPVPTSSEAPSNAGIFKAKTSSSLDFSDIGVLEDVSSDEDDNSKPASEKVDDRKQKEATHTWSSTSETTASESEGEERRRRSRNDSPSRKSRKSKRDSGSPKRRRHKDSKRRRERSISPASSKEYSKPLSGRTRSILNPRLRSLPRRCSPRPLASPSLPRTRHSPG